MGNFAKAMATPHGPRKLRAMPSQVKFGKSTLVKNDFLHPHGVFADADFKEGEIVEMCPCLVLDYNGASCMVDNCFYLPPIEVDLGDRTIVKRGERWVLPLGNGSIYNHLPAGQDNVTWFYDETTQCVIYVASLPDGKKKIERNEELCFDYGEDYWNDGSRRYRAPDSAKTSGEVWVDAMKEMASKRPVRDSAGQIRYI
eukprot:NODE_4689_length_650_cov_178.157983.p1 GENE.NODE_4689_length_650_cov_178.157983~~NODE_4689_length_650_cov_178.157983.p1  ORF type:complete len:199 (+),score=33.65 NODE_4689_length_650_cov_178.157983:3-599(+)